MDDSCGSEGQPMSPGGEHPLAGRGTPTQRPPRGYWEGLKASMPPEQLQELRSQFEQGVMEFKASALPPPRSEADRLLSRLANDGWLVRTERYKCQVCGTALAVDEISWPECPNCQTLLDQSAPQKEIVFVHEVPQARSVDWAV